MDRDDAAGTALMILLGMGSALLLGLWILTWLFTTTS